ncbi:hypothetical protein QTN25_000524 [Entamoeba marina]
MTIVLYSTHIPSIISDIYLKLTNPKKSNDTSIWVDLSLFILQCTFLIITNFLIMTILYFFMFKGMSIIITIIGIIYHFFTLIISVHTIYPTQTQNILKPCELKTKLIAKCKEINIDVQEIKVVKENVTIFTGVNDKKILLISENLIDTCDCDEVVDYVLFYANHDFGFSLKIFFLSVIRIIILYMSCEYIFFKINSFFDIGANNVSLGVVIIQYIYVRLSELIHFIFNSLERYLCWKGIDIVLNHGNGKFGDCLIKLIKENYICFHNNNQPLPVNVKQYSNYDNNIDGDDSENVGDITEELPTTRTKNGYC